MAHLRLVQSGIQRLYRSNQATKVRLPITTAILTNIKKHWTPQQTDPDIIMLWAAAAICFFGFFRAGEITIPTLSFFDSPRHLAWGDLGVDDTEQPQMLKIHLRKSKVDQLGKGIDVYIGETNCRLCPVTAAVHYMSLRGSAPGPFFRFNDGSPLTKSSFTGRIREVLKALGLPEDNFAGHSFRIGAATAAARAGIEDSVIRAMGRWNSSAFLVYICTPR